MKAQQRLIRRGDVFWTSYVFPHERATDPGDTSVEKQRPVLIVQNDADNKNVYYPIVQAAPITTRKTERIFEQDVLLPAGEANLKQTSKALLGLTQPFLRTRLGQKSGRVSLEMMRKVDVKLLRLFGFVRNRQ